MPESAGGSARLVKQLLVKEVGRRQIAPVLRNSVQKQKLSAEQNAVKLILFHRISGDGAIGSDKLIDRTLDVVEVARIGGVQPHRIHAFQKRAQFIVPDPVGTGRRQAPIGPAHDDRVGRAL